VIERLPKPLHASVRRALRQAWELDDADKAERLLRNLARRLDQEASGVAPSILEGLDEMLTVNRLKLPAKRRRSLACTNSIENMMGTVRRVCRNVKECRHGAPLDGGRHDGSGAPDPQSCPCRSRDRTRRHQKD
jgi:putative transposase